MSNINVIPDTTFFICFIEDIQDYESLIKIFKYENFLFVVVNKVKDELINSSNYKKIEEYINEANLYYNEFCKQFKDEQYNFKEILRPFFSKKQIKKGEDEVIVIAFIMYNIGKDIIFILDDKNARNFVENNFDKEFCKKMCRTTRFIVECCCKFKIFNKDETINILNSIKNSKFRIDPNIINELKDEIHRC